MNYETENILNGEDIVKIIKVQTPLVRLCKKNGRQHRGKKLRSERPRSRYWKTSKG